MDKCPACKENIYPDDESCSDYSGVYHIECHEKEAAKTQWLLEAAMLYGKEFEVISLEDCLGFAKAALENISGDIENETPADGVSAEREAALD